MADTNVNDWHWLQKDITKCTEHLIGSVDSVGTIANVDELEGDATVCQRKGKLFCVYDISLEFEFEAEQTFRFRLKDILSDCEDWNDFECSVDPSGLPAHQKELVLKRVLECFEQMRQEACDQQGRELLSRTKPVQQVTPLEDKSLSKEFKHAPSITPATNGKFKTDTLTMKLSFSCPARAVWDCLFDPARFDAWSRSKGSKVLPLPGSPYRIYDGNITGKFLECEPYRSVSFAWRHSSWPAEHYSTVRLQFEDINGESRISFHQSDVPTAELERTRENWNNYIWTPIKQIFGYASI